MKGVFRKVLMFFLLFSVLLTMFIEYPSTLNSVDAASNYVVPGYTFYIKNVRSGKYLTVDGNEASDGTNVVQKTYNGSNSQRWLINYYSTGIHANTYKFYTVMDVNKCLEIESAQSVNGLNAQLTTSSNATRQFFTITDLPDFSHVIYTNASNFIKALAVQNASCSDGANVFQYSYNATNNDQWLIEPAYSNLPVYGAAYAKANYHNRMPTYPDVDTLGGDCTNFVSQCLVAAGHRYTDTWYVNKKNNNYLAPSDISELNAGWSLSSPSPWISAPAFRSYWAPRVNNKNEYTLSQIINNTNTYSNVNYTMGDVVQIIKKNPFSEQTVHTMYISETPSNYSNKGSYVVTYHTNDTLSRTIASVCQAYTHNNGTYTVVFYDFT